MAGAWACRDGMVLRARRRDRRDRLSEHADRYFVRRSTSRGRRELALGPELDHVGLGQIA
jgi:hypothetical protein